MFNFKAPDNVALIRVDIQNTFTDGGNLAVAGGQLIIPTVNALSKCFNTVVDTQDWHPAGHSSFASTHERNPFERVWMKGGVIVGEIQTDTQGNPMDKPEHAPVQGALVQTLWTDHGVQNTEDAAFHPDLERDGAALGVKNMLHLQKGTNKKIDSYSGFYENDGVTQPKFDNGKTLTETLKGLGVDTAVFVGLASDFCVGWHATDAIKEGFNAVVIYNATKPIAAPIADGVTTETLMLDEMKRAGVKVINTADVPKLLAA